MALSQVSATVDKNPVIANESFILEVVADDDVDTNALDTSVLMKDFIVGRTSVSSQTSMVNFNTTKTTRWTTVLIARKPGTLTIPSLTIENERTVPITLTVLSASDTSTNQQKDIFITTDISSKNVYVQQQLTLTVKLHFAAELKRGSLTEPSLENANIIQIGKDVESDTIINGRRYRVIERTYAINPQQSGEYTLMSPVFSGEIMVPSTRRSNFLSFGETKPVSVIGEEIPLTVRPIPTSYQGQWLPSELLSLHQEWQPSPDKFMVGEPITRTITLTAAGLSQEQLPIIEMAMPPGLKIYPDQAELHTGMNSNRLVSQKVQNFAIVASRAGSYQLPEISIAWWNTVTNQYQQATLPAQTITVKANPAAAQEKLAPQIANSANQPQAPTTIVVRESSWLQWLFLALWLLTSLAWLISSRKKHQPKPVTTNAKNKSLYLALLAACKKNNGQQVLTLLVPWVNELPAISHPVATIDEALAMLKSDAFSQAVNELQQCYFGKSHQDWRGDNMLVAIEAIYKNQQSPSANIALSLNP